MKPGSVTRDQEAGSKNGNFKNGDWTAEAIEGVEVAGNNSATRGIAAISRISNSLEGLGGRWCCKVFSDTTSLIGPLEHKSLIGAVRTAAACRHPLNSALLSKFAPLGAP
jgi:hypothetical protein